MPIDPKPNEHSSRGPGGGVAPTNQPPQGTGTGTGSKPMPDAVPGVPEGQLGSTGDPNKDEARARLIKEYPQLAVYLDHPELGPLLVDWFTGENASLGALQGLISQTDWWKTTGSLARDFDKRLSMDPATVRNEINQAANTIDSLARRLGLNLRPDELFSMSVSYLRFGWRENELNRALGYTLIAKQDSYGPGFRLPKEGEARDLANRLRSMAADYLIEPTPDQVVKWTANIVMGLATEEGFRSFVMGRARARFPDLADDIDAGMTPGEYFEGHTSAVSRLLGIPVTTADLMKTPRFGHFTQFVDKNGIRRSMTVPEAEEWARGQPEFQNSPQGDQAYQGMSEQLLRAFGALA